MSRIIIGKSDHQNIKLDIKALLRTHMLIWASTGGGKSYLIRRLVEQMFGKVPIIIVDREGEFPTLREKFGFVLVGPGGETPADPRSAKMVIERLLEMNASAVIDLFELGVEARHEWVRNAYLALVNAPKRLWGPTTVWLDEAHSFAPEKGQGESIAYSAVTDFNGVARKRGFGSIFATQRLAKLSKNATAEMYNQAAGPTAQQSDRDRAAYEMGISKGAEYKEFSESLRTLEPGNFFFQGRAISMDRLLVKVGPVQTSHGTETTGKHAKKTPTPAEVKKMLPKLADLPKQAEEEAKTEKELKATIRSLKAALRAAPASNGGLDTKEIGRALSIQAKKYAPLLAMLREAMKVIVKVNAIGFEGSAVTPEQISNALAATAREIAKVAQTNIKSRRQEFDKLKLDTNRLLGRMKSLLENENVEVALEVTRNEPVTARPPQEHHQRQARPVVEGNGDVTRPQMAILRALAEFEAIQRDQVPKPWVAARAGASFTSSAFTNNLGLLRTGGYITYPVQTTAKLTDLGRSTAGEIDAPETNEEMLQSCLALLERPQQRILKALYDAHPQAVDKRRLAELAGASFTSSAFTNNLGRLRSIGMVDYPDRGSAKCADWLFIE